MFSSMLRNINKTAAGDNLRRFKKAGGREYIEHLPLLYGISLLTATASAETGKSQQAQRSRGRLGGRH